MGMSVIDAFVVTFGIDTKGVEKGERDINDATKRLQDKSKRAFGDMESQSKLLGDSLKKVRNEVVGLGLAFMGASSITGFIGHMMTGAAAADRMGTSIGMNAKQIWAWRMAAKSQGGQASEADTALQSIQNDRMDFRFGRMDGAKAGIYGRLGVSAADLRDGDAGTILKKIAGMQGKMDPQVYASLLQQLGMPSSIVYFLQQGKDSVDKLLKQFEAEAKGQEQLAKETEELQKSITTLQATIMQKLVPPLVQIANFLNKVIGGGSSDPAPGPPKGGSVYKPTGLWGQLFGEVYHPSGRQGGGVAAPGASGAKGPHGAESEVYSFLRSKGLASDQALGITAALWAESRLDPKATNPTSGAYGISQILSKDRLANFQRLFGHSIKGAPLNEQLEFLWWELNGGDHGGKAVLAERGIGTSSAMINSFLRPKAGYETARDLRDAAKFINQHRANGTITIHGGIHIKTAATDAKAIARDIHHALKRRHAVAQADRGVNP